MEERTVLGGIGRVLAASKGWVTKGWTSQNIDKPTGQNTEIIIYELSHTCRALGLLRVRQWCRQTDHLSSKEALCFLFLVTEGQGGKLLANLISLDFSDTH